MAIRDDKIEAVKLLMSNGANAYLTNNQGDNAFMTAALRGKGDILAHLIEVASPTKIQVWYILFYQRVEMLYMT